MNHPVQAKIDLVRRRARRISLVYGIGWAAVIFIISALAVCALDYYLRVEYRPVRLLQSVAVLLIVGWGFFRYLLPQIKSHASDVAIAQRVQSRFPYLHDKLASAVEFLKQPADDPSAGSSQLRRAVIADAAADVDDLDLDEVVDRRPAIRAILGAGGAVLAAVAVVLISPATSQLALARLVNPLGGNVWPRVNNLVFVDPPARLASGSMFEVELHDAHQQSLPDEVVIEYRYEDESGFRVFSEPMRFAGGAMVAHRDNVRRPFAYRARGGDDNSMLWHPLEVVEPPRVESLEVRLTPPAYSGWPAVANSGRVVGLVGTQVELTGISTKPLARAALVVPGGERLPATIRGDGLTFSIPADGAAAWVIKESGSYRFELVDTEQIVGGADDQWQVRAIPDEPPTVAVEKPPAEIFVTPEATLPIRVLAKDRLAIRDISLRYFRSDDSDKGEQQMALFTGPDRVAAPKGTNPAIEMIDGDRKVVEKEWDLNPLELAPGTQITFYASAFDYQPAEGKSPTQRIFVISQRDLENRLAGRQASILSDLARAVKRQQEARSRTTELEIQLDEVGKLGDADLDQLQGLELAQREVRRSLAGDTESVLRDIGALLAELENNKVDSPDITRRMTHLAELVQRLDKDDLGIIERELTGAQKNIQANLNDATQRDDPGAPEAPKDSDPAKDPEPAKNDTPKDNEQSARNKQALDALARAGQHQDAVIESLQEVLGDLQRWENSRRFAREIATLEDDQRKTHRATEEMRPRTLGQDVKDLDPQDRADLKKAAEKQFELARRFDKIMQGMEQAGNNMAEKDPLAAESMADAAHHARQKGIGSKMRSAGRNVENNQVGQASGRQKSVGQDLQEMLDILSNRREHELSRLVKKLREAEDELDDLAKKHEGLLRKIKEAAKNADEEQRRRELQRLTREQKQIEEEIKRLARRLERLQANRAGKKLGEAAGRMAQAGQAGQQGDAGGASEQSDQAQKDLEDAQKRLEQARKKAEADLAQEQLARLEDKIKGMLKRQQVVLDETGRLEKQRNEQGRLTRGQLVSVTDLSLQETALKEEVHVIAQKLAGAEVFRRALQRAAGDMNLAAERLSRLDTGAVTQKNEQDAIARLALIVESFKKDPQQNDQQNSGAGQGGGDSQGQALRSLAELKLAKLMQQDVNRRTEENRQVLERRLGDGEDVTELMLERAELAEEQGELADIIFDILDQQDSAPEANPDDLPDLGPIDSDDNNETDPDADTSEPADEDAE